MDSYDNLDDMHNETLIRASDIWYSISAYAPFQAFKNKLIEMFDVPGKRSRQDHKPSTRRFSTVVYPTRSTMEEQYAIFQTVIEEMMEAWPLDATQIEITSISLVIQAIKCPQYIACFLACLAPGSLYGIRDRLSIMVDIYGELEDDKRTESPSNLIIPDLKRGVFTRFVDAIAFWKILQEDENAIIHVWPAPDGFGFISNLVPIGSPLMSTNLRLRHCKNDSDTLVCTQYLVDPFTIESTLPIPDEHDMVLDLLKQTKVRVNISDMFVQDKHICDVLMGMTHDEWCYAMRCYMAKHSSQTLDYVYPAAILAHVPATVDAPVIGNVVAPVGRNQKRHHATCLPKSEQFTALLTHGRDKWEARLMSNLFTGNRLNIEMFVNAFNGDDPFLNESYDMSCYDQIESKAKPKKNDVMRQYIDTKCVRLVQHNSTVNFSPSEINHVIGQWVDSFKFKTYNDYTQREVIMEYIKWLEIHRMSHFMIMDEEFRDVKRSEFPQGVIEEIMLHLETIVID